MALVACDAQANVEKGLTAKYAKNASTYAAGMFNSISNDDAGR
jgi:hypothetical protein